MAKYKTCPHCFAQVQQGARCQCQESDNHPDHEYVDTRLWSQRQVAAPHRSNYSTPEYRKNRQVCMARAAGRCEHCGKQIAFYDGVMWRMNKRGAGMTDHIIPLRSKGTNHYTNLQLVCVLCHNIADARKRGRT